jgi:nucleolar MIF4G domain-containing protein 1
MPSHPNLRLPQTLLDQLDGPSGDPGSWKVVTGFDALVWLDTISRTRRGRSNPHRPKVSRKETRKQNREEKKRRKAEYFSSVAINAKRVALSPHPESPPHKRTKVAELPRPQVSDVKPGRTLSKPPSGVAGKINKSAALSGIASTWPITRSDSPTLPRSRRDEDDERYIAFLEAKLNSGNGSKKGAGYAKEIDNDGLGGEQLYLLHAVYL